MVLVVVDAELAELLPPAPPAAAAPAAPPPPPPPAPPAAAAEAAAPPPEPTAAVSSSTEVVVVVEAEPLGNELVSRSRVAAPNSENGFVMALSNQAPDEAPPEAIRFSAVPAIEAIGRETVSSMPERIPSAKTLFAFDKLVAMFCIATPAVVMGRPTVSL